MKININKSELTGLLIAIKKDMRKHEWYGNEGEDKYCEITIGYCPDKKDWNIQTGDNSYTGGAYGYLHWGVGSIYPTTNCKDLATDLINQIADLIEY